MKKLSFVFDWIGPSGPLRNGVIPDIVELAVAHDHQLTFKNPPNRPLLNYNLYHSFLRYGIVHEIIPTYSITQHESYSDIVLQKKSYLYELTTTECINLERLFNDYSGIFSNYDDTFVSKELLERVRLLLVRIVISHPFESFLSDEILLRMHRYFEKLKIPLSQVIYATSCINGQAVYLDFCQRHNLPNHLNCEFIPTYWLDLRVHHTYPTGSKHLYPSGYSYSSTYTPGPRSKDFICLNRRYRDHRILFGLLLHKHNLLDKCFFSLDKTRPENGESFIDFVHQGAVHEANYCADSLSDLELSFSDVDTFHNILPLVIDTTNFNDIISNQLNNTVIDVYNDSLVHIISETNFFSPIVHMTEKTLKPVVYLQPFIMLGSANSLRCLRELGFKTFSDFWDESYDVEIDSVLRLKKIIKLCETISSWSQQKKLQFTYDVKEIVEYNYNHFLHGDIPALNDWMEKYGN
jgi:hypothetical protein